MLPTPPLNIQVRAVQIIAIVFANQFDTPINKPFDKSQCFIIPPNSLPAIVPKQLYDKFLERNCRNSKPCDIFQNGQFFFSASPVPCGCMNVRVCQFNVGQLTSLT